MVYEVTVEVLPEQPTAVVRGTMTIEEIPAWLGHAYGAVFAHLSAHGRAPAGPPFARYWMGEGKVRIEAGFPVSEPVEDEGEVEASELPGGEAAVTWHVGPYDAMTPAYAALEAWIGDKGASMSGPPWEVYYSDPADEPDAARWRTEIVAPFRRY